MPGDISRDRFRREQHNTSVRLQQGRVMLDAEWNEHADIQLHRVETEALDTIGLSGAPAANAGFLLTPTTTGNDLVIAPGRFYVDGILCECEQSSTPITVSTQPDLIGALPTAPGSYLAYLDVWQQERTAAEQDELREVALGGPDTATRRRTVWQVRFFAAGDVNASPACTSFPAGWTPGNISTGTLSAMAASNNGQDLRCGLSPAGGFAGLENQLYRVEIHNSSLSGTATFKWSRDNGSVAAPITMPITGNQIQLIDPGNSVALNFDGVQWVELIDDTLVQQGQPGVMLPVTLDGTILNVTSWPGGSLAASGFPASPVNPVARRWDMPAGTAPVPITPNISQLLEDGITVQFGGPAIYNTGDYWLIPARTLTGTIDWPADPASPSTPMALPRLGAIHHYAPLGLVKFDGQAFTTLSDCRPVFPPLSAVNTFFYVGGDGQQALTTSTGSTPPLFQLPAPLEVGVSTGAGAVVQFAVIAGSGQVQASGGTAGTSIQVTTGASGIAACSFFLDATTPLQRVAATLISAGAVPPPLPIHFNATLNTNSNVAGVQITGVTLNSSGQALANDSVITQADLTGGIQIQCSQPLDPVSVNAANCSVTIQYPILVPPQGQFAGPLPPSQVAAWFPMVLDATTTAPSAPAGINWNPSTGAQTWIASIGPQLLLPAKRTDLLLLCRLTLRGNFIWSVAQNPRLLLDGDSFGSPAPASTGGPGTSVTFPSGDGQPGGDFEMWFWLGQNQAQAQPQKRIWLLINTRSTRIGAAKAAVAAKWLTAAIDRTKLAPDLPGYTLQTTQFDPPTAVRELALLEIKLLTITSTQTLAAPLKDLVAMLETDSVRFSSTTFPDNALIGRISATETDGEPDLVMVDDTLLTQVQGALPAEFGQTVVQI